MIGKDIFDGYLTALRRKPIAEKTEHTDRAALEGQKSQPSLVQQFMAGAQSASLYESKGAFLAS